MKKEQFDNLKRGDIIRHKGDPESYVIEATHNRGYVAVRTIDVTNPSEWVKVT